MKELIINKKITNRSKTFESYLADAKKWTSIDNEEEYKNFKLWIETGNLKYREAILNSYLLFSISVAKYYSSNADDLLDLIQESNKGLIEAFDKFDISKGFKFYSFAVYHCRKNCILFIKDKSVIKLSDDLQNWERKFSILYDNFYQLNERIPSEEELLKISKEKYSELDTKLNIGRLVSRFYNKRYLLPNINSTNSAVGDDAILEDFISDNDEQLFDKEDKEENLLLISNILNNTNLSELEKDLIYYHFKIGNFLELSQIEFKHKVNLCSDDIPKKIRYSLNKIKNKNKLYYLNNLD